MRRLAFALAWTALALSAAVQLASWFGVSLFERFASSRCTDRSPGSSRKSEYRWQLAHVSRLFSAERG